MDGYFGTWLTHPIGIFGLLGRAGVLWSEGRGTKRVAIGG
jgi:hypothetical protein